MDVFFRFSLYVVRHSPLSQKWIHTYCWLIEDQELRVVHQSNREGYSTLLATAAIRKQFRRWQMESWTISQVSTLDVRKMKELVEPIRNWRRIVCVVYRNYSYLRCYYRQASRRSSRRNETMKRRGDGISIQAKRKEPVVYKEDDTR